MTQPEIEFARLVRDVLSKAAPAEFEGTTPASSDFANAHCAHNRTCGYPRRIRKTGNYRRRRARTRAAIGATHREAARLTPLAADIIKERGIEIVRRVSRKESIRPERLPSGRINGGYPMKEDSNPSSVNLVIAFMIFGTNSGECGRLS